MVELLVKVFFPLKIHISVRLALHFAQLSLIPRMLYARSESDTYARCTIIFSHWKGH